MHHYLTLFHLKGAGVPTVIFIKNKQHFDECAFSSHAKTPR